LVEPGDRVLAQVWMATVVEAIGRWSSGTSSRSMAAGRHKR
jgi:hypothetical protein